MNYKLVLFLISFAGWLPLSAQTKTPVILSKNINGVLKRLPSNQRYFTDNGGKAILLTGSHTWENFQVMNVNESPSKFNWTGYLDMMVKNNHNYIRLWVWEHPTRVTWSTKLVDIDPMPYKRAGKGLANDGKPRFDLDQWNEQYFQRMRDRVIDAGQRGIYVSVMMFQGFSQNKNFLSEEGDPFLSHPYNKANNVNGIDVINTNSDEEGKPTLHSLGNKAALARQEAYVRKVIETVNDLDNVLYEIINEGGATDWCYHMINYIRDQEKKMPKQHMIGLGNRVIPPMPNQELWDSPADYVSPTSEPAEWLITGSVALNDYQKNPPANNHDKVCIVDTDHIWGLGGNYKWAWKSFLRGHHPIFMDPWLGHAGIDSTGFGRSFITTGGITVNDMNHPDFPPLRENMGYIRKWAEKIELLKMAPSDELSSTKYCLANPGQEYLVYFPEGGKATINLVPVKGEMEVEWFIPSLNKLIKGTETLKGGYFVVADCPFSGDAVLYLKKK